jgi:hypothetical protein
MDDDLDSRSRAVHVNYGFIIIVRSTKFSYIKYIYLFDIIQ